MSAAAGITLDINVVVQLLQRSGDDSRTASRSSSDHDLSSLEISNKVTIKSDGEKQEKLQAFAMLTRRYC